MGKSRHRHNNMKFNFQDVHEHEIRCNCYPIRYHERCDCYFQTDNEHIANIITHAVPIPFVLYGIWLLSFHSRNVTEVIVALVYGFSLLSIFVVSAVFHWKCYTSPKKTPLQSLDRSAIYIDIASSYMPWLILGEFEHHVWYTSVWTIYFIAALGILFELTWSRHYPIIGILYYLFTGLVPSTAIILNSDVPGKIGIVVSGMTYIFGIYFFRVDGKIPYAHAIWHMFVVVASIIHFLNVYTCFYLH